MSLYYSVSDKASGWSRRHWEHLRECQWFAQQIASGYAAHLGAPPGVVTFVLITPDLTFGKEHHGIDQPLALPQGRNGLHYFGLNVHFEAGMFGSHSRSLFGIRKKSRAWEVEYDGQVSEVPFDDMNELTTVFERIVQGALLVYESDDKSPRLPIGFVEPTYAPRSIKER